MGLPSEPPNRSGTAMAAADDLAEVATLEHLTRARSGHGAVTGHRARARSPKEGEK